MHLRDAGQVDLDTAGRIGFLADTTRYGNRLASDTRP
jgi:hypothetical protein